MQLKSHIPFAYKYLYIIFCVFLEGCSAVLALIKCTDPSLMSAGFYVCHEGRGCDRALISAIIPDATHTHSYGEISI